MAYQDRMTMEIKEFGRKVVITVNRGQVSEPKTRDGKTVLTITYDDAPSRKAGKSK